MGENCSHQVVEGREVGSRPDPIHPYSRILLWSSADSSGLNRDVGIARRSYRCREEMERGSQENETGLCKQFSGQRSLLSGEPGSIEGLVVPALVDRRELSCFSPPIQKNKSTRSSQNMTDCRSKRIRNVHFGKQVTHIYTIKINTIS